MRLLSNVATMQSVQLIVWSITLLAITTSIIGVGVGLFDTLKRGVSNKLASVQTVLPAYLVVIYVPNAFITVLGFAGMILAVIAILLPAYLLWQVASQQWNYLELKKNWLARLSLGMAMLVIACEVYNILP